LRFLLLSLFLKIIFKIGGNEFNLVLLIIGKHNTNFVVKHIRWKQMD